MGIQSNGNAGSFLESFSLIKMFPLSFSEILELLSGMRGFREDVRHDSSRKVGETTRWAPTKLGLQSL